MEPIRIFYAEGLSLFALTALVLARHGVLRRKVLAGLVRNQQQRVSGVKIQLLVVTLALALRYLVEVAQAVAAGGQQGMPKVGPVGLVALGLSGGVYGVGMRFQAGRQ